MTTNKRVELPLVPCDWRGHEEDVRCSLEAYRVVQRDADQLLFDAQGEKLAASEARERAILRLLQDLTPTGSEFQTPERCIAWINEQLRTQQASLVKTIRERNEAEAREKRLAELMEEVEADRIGGWTERERAEDDLHHSVLIILTEWGKEKP